MRRRNYVCVAVAAPFLVLRQIHATPPGPERHAAPAGAGRRLRRSDRSRHLASMESAPSSASGPARGSAGSWSSPARATPSSHKQTGEEVDRRTALGGGEEGSPARRRQRRPAPLAPRPRSSRRSGPRRNPQLARHRRRRRPDHRRLRPLDQGRRLAGRLLARRWNVPRRQPPQPQYEPRRRGAIVNVNGDSTDEQIASAQRAAGGST